MNHDSVIPDIELEIVRGQAQNKRRRIAVPAFLIGSSHDCDLVLAASEFPDMFAYIIVDESGVMVRHLGAAPDLVHNGKPVADAKLRDGDRLNAGPYQFVIHIAERHGSRNSKATPSQRVSAGVSSISQRNTDVAPLRAALRLVNDIRAAIEAPRQSVRRTA